MSESDDAKAVRLEFEPKLITELPCGKPPPVIGPFPVQPLAEVAMLPSKEDPAKLEVQYCLAQAIAADFVEVIVIGVRTKKDGGGFVCFGSSQDAVRALGMIEVCKRDVLAQIPMLAKPTTPGAA